MKKLFLKRLKEVMYQHEVTTEGLAESYVENTYMPNKMSALPAVNRFLRGCNNTITIYDIVACAKACNCTADYLLGLSENIN